MWMLICLNCGLFLRRSLQLLLLLLSASPLLFLRACKLRLLRLPRSLRILLVLLRMCLKLLRLRVLLLLS